MMFFQFKVSHQLSTPDDTTSDFIHNQVAMQAPMSEGLVPDLLGNLYNNSPSFKRVRATFNFR